MVLGYFRSNNSLAPIYYKEHLVRLTLAAAALILEVILYYHQYYKYRVS